MTLSLMLTVGQRGLGTSRGSSDQGRGLVARDPTTSQCVHRNRKSLFDPKFHDLNNNNNKLL